MDFQRGCFLMKKYAKMKELGPIGGRVPETLYVDPPLYRIDRERINTILHVLSPNRIINIKLCQMKFVWEYFEAFGNILR